MYSCPSGRDNLFMSETSELMQAQSSPFALNAYLHGMTEQEQKAFWDTSDLCSRQINTRPP
jgi:hypothetical protein